MVKRLIKILIFELILILGIIFLLTGSPGDLKGLFTNSIGNKVIEYTYEGLNGNINLETNPKLNKNNFKENKFTNNKANDEEYIYKILKDGLFNGEANIVIDLELINGDTDKLFNIIEKILLENPDILYYTGGKYYKGIFTPQFSKPIEEKLLHQELIREQRDKVLASIIKDNMTPYEMIKEVHDYIINTTRYDKDHLRGREVSSESYTVYGVLIKGKAVCEGYAKTMKYLLDSIGIENLIVTGFAGGESHAWNMVKIEGDYYHIDATWNDTVTEDSSNMLVYDYFNLKDEDIGVSHQWDRDKYPRCNSDKYNYFYYNRLVVNNYEEFYKQIERALLNGERSIFLKIPNFTGENYRIHETIETIARNNLDKISIENYAYSFNKGQKILRIYF